MASFVVLTPNKKHFEMDKVDKVINLGIPHVGELIFESIDTSVLIQYFLVTKTWKVLAENVLIKRWKGKMFQACKNGETKVVELLLERCNSEESGLNTKDTNGWTAFMIACFYGPKNVVQLLLNYSERIELNARTYLGGSNAFMMACNNGHTDVVKLLLDHTERIELNARDDYEETAFMLACQSGHKDVVKLLMDNSDRNIEFNARDNGSMTAFMWVCHDGHKDIVKLLLDNSDRSIELNARDNEGTTAFIWACYNDHKDVVKLILDNSYRNIELNARDIEGWTAFMWACNKEKKEVVLLLLKYSEIVNIDTTGLEDISEEIKDIIVNYDLHQDASKELKHFIQMHQDKRRKYS